MDDKRIAHAPLECVVGDLQQHSYPVPKYEQLQIAASFLPFRHQFRLLFILDTNWTQRLG
jgi:hypothetical protein